jgi:histidinol-phosphate phosphatase family protein
LRQAVILAGGKGTRLRSVLGDVPKALAPIEGAPLLDHQLRLLLRHGFDDVVLLVNHGADQIRDWLSAPHCPPIRWRLVDDGEPRGTAGAVLAALPELREEFAVLYGDTMLNVDLTRFWSWHASDPAAAGSLFIHPNDHPADSDLIEQDANGRIVKFHPYPHPPDAWLPNLVNAALYILRRDALEPWRDVQGPLDFGKTLFPAMLEKGQRLRGYISPEYIKDAGTPDRLERVRRSFASSAITRAELRQRQKAVLIDRDGTLNREAGHLKRAEDLELFPGVGPALHRLNVAGWLTVVVTNQPVLARGETTEAELRRIHARLDSELAQSHAYYDRLYYCPHHPDRGFPGEVAALKIVCDCRKPAPGLIARAQADLNFDPAESWFVGDSTADLGAAEAAGLSSILVATGQAGRDGLHPYHPSFRAPDFAAAVAFILDIFPRIAAAAESLAARIQPGEDWFVGGMPGAGKSTLAASLAHLLRQRGHTVVTIPLQNWAEHHAAAITLDQVHARYAGPVTFDLPFPTHQAQQKSVTVPQGATVIWDGLAAIDLAQRSGNLSHAIQAERGAQPDANRPPFRFSFDGLLPRQTQE